MIGLLLFGVAVGVMFVIGGISDALHERAQNAKHRKDKPLMTQIKGGPTWASRVPVCPICHRVTCICRGGVRHEH